MKKTEQLLSELVRRIDFLENGVAAKIADQDGLGNSKFEQLAYDLLNSFTHFKTVDFDHQVKIGLEQVARAFDIDLATIYLFNWHTQKFYLTCQWPEMPVPDQIDNQFGWLRQQMMENRNICINTVEDFPVMAKNERKMALEKKISSFIAIPFQVDEAVTGYLFINALGRNRSWDTLIERRLKFIGRIFGSFFARRYWFNKFSDIFNLQVFLKEVANALLDAPVSDITQTIENAIEKINPYIGADICALFSLSQKSPLLVISYISDLKNLTGWQNRRTLFSIPATSYPWLVNQIDKKASIKLDSPMQLPGDAVAEKKVLASLGVAACMAVPVVMKTGGQGVLLAGRVGPENNFTDQDLEAFGLFSDLIGKGLNRKETVQELLSSRRIYQSMIDHLDLGSFEVLADTHMTIVDANAQLVKLMGENSKEKLISNSLLKDYMSKEDRKNFLKVLSQKGALEGFDTKFKKKDNSELHIKLSLEPGENKHEKIRYYRGLVLDRSKQVETQKRLDHSQSEISKLKQSISREKRLLIPKKQNRQSHHGIIGESRHIHKVVEKINQVAKTESAVLIFGETGTGKELVAKAIHELGSRCDRFMVNVNCAALPGSLIESELFGREKGAYTGALTSQIGRFESADKSTLFLDEISELPLQIQAKLLRVLEDGKFEKLGSTSTVNVDVRLIAATNRDLEKDIQEGRFRNDLFFRLNVFPIVVPPLRERKEDIPILVWHFIKLYSRSMGKLIEHISQEDMESLQSHHWPGNVRELKNVIEKAMIECQGHVLQVKLNGQQTLAAGEFITMEEMQIRHIRSALAKTRNIVSGKKGAANLLGMNPKTLWSRMKKLGISS